MNNFKVLIADSINIKTLHDGRSAFVFLEHPYRVALIGTLALAVSLLLKDAGGLFLDDLRNMLIKNIQFENNGQKTHFDNAVLCTVGQLINLGVISRMDNGK